MSNLIVDRALISVSNKEGIETLGVSLQERMIPILSTGNTAKVLISKGIKVTEVSKFTNSPEMFGGRVKTLHPIIMGGILFRGDNQTDLDEARKHGIQRIGLVAVNLYPFEEASQNKSLTAKEIIENIDIGGPSLIRAAAKNLRDVCIVTSPDDYDEVTRMIAQDGITPEYRYGSVQRAFRLTSRYDALIADWFADNPDEVMEYMRKAA
ncbi:MAG: hypothetical protein AAB632_03110 [Patescibacteria group bacterium]